jgi:TMEM175 potassium channel family protein
VSTTRLEAFSDGVIAVAITLLVLNVDLPELRPGESLFHGLVAQWQVYVAYITSFLTIGIIWINHHVMIGRLREADRMILFLNLLLLMSIGILPFATRLMATYLKQPHGEHLAMAVYSGSFFVMAVCFSILNRHILLIKAHMLHADLPFEQRRHILFRSLTGVIPYGIATALALVSPYLTLAICIGLAIFYAFPLGFSDADA